MRKFFKYLPYYLVVFFFYCPLYGFFILLLQNPKLTELYLLNIFILSPVVVFIVSLLYSYRFGFSLHWLLGSCLLYGFHYQVFSAKTEKQKTFTKSLKNLAIML